MFSILSACAGSCPSGPVWCSTRLVLLQEVLPCLVTLACVHLLPGVSTALAGCMLHRGPSMSGPWFKDRWEEEPRMADTRRRRSPRWSCFLIHCDLSLPLSIFLFSFSFFFLGSSVSHCMSPALPSNYLFFSSFALLQELDLTMRIFLGEFTVIKSPSWPSLHVWPGCTIFFTIYLYFIFLPFIIL